MSRTLPQQVRDAIGDAEVAYYGAQDAATLHSFERAVMDCFRTNPAARPALLDHLTAMVDAVSYVVDNQASQSIRTIIANLERLQGLEAGTGVPASAVAGGGVGAVAGAGAPASAIGGGARGHDTARVARHLLGDHIAGFIADPSLVSIRALLDLTRTAIGDGRINANDAESILVEGLLETLISREEGAEEITFPEKRGCVEELNRFYRENHRTGTEREGHLGVFLKTLSGRVFAVNIDDQSTATVADLVQSITRSVPGGHNFRIIAYVDRDFPEHAVNSGVQDITRSCLHVPLGDLRVSYMNCMHIIFPRDFNYDRLAGVDSFAVTSSSGRSGGSFAAREEDRLNNRGHEGRGGL
jgi:hypothetical protein